MVDFINKLNNEYNKIDKTNILEQIKFSNQIDQELYRKELKIYLSNKINFDEIEAVFNLSNLATDIYLYREANMFNIITTPFIIKKRNSMVFTQLAKNIKQKRYSI